MKVLFLVPKRYSLFHVFKKVFLSRGCEVIEMDFLNHVSRWEQAVEVQMFRFPDKVRRIWERHYLGKINAYYVGKYTKTKPDLVFIYNSEMLLPETLALFRKNAKVAMFMGDHPFYTPANRYYLPLLLHADAVFAPDTFWMDQLAKMGARKVFFMVPGIPEDQYHPEELKPGERKALQTEVLYVGMSYSDSWGYKKAMFLNGFTDFDLQIHGNKQWKRWLPFFPRLADHFTEQTAHYPITLMNKMYNATRIIPVDGNPGLLHGIHLRTFEALGAGALPLLEWQKDLERVFGADIELPAVREYGQIQEVAAYFLDHENARRELVERMRAAVQERFSIAQLSALVFDALRCDGCTYGQQAALNSRT